MVRKAEVVLEWGPGEYLFALKMGQIEALESECLNSVTQKPGVGIGAIWLRVMSGEWFFSDIRNIIRHGLIGGGMGAVEANRLCKNYVDNVPISGAPPTPDCPLTVAQAILAAAIVGVEDREGKGEPLTPEK